MAQRGLPTRDEHLGAVASQAEKNTLLRGEAALGVTGTEAALLRIEGLLARLVELLEQPTLCKGEEAVAPAPAMAEVMAQTRAKEEAPVADLDALSVSELRALCDEHGLECGRKRKAEMRAALRDHGVG